MRTWTTVFLLILVTLLILWLVLCETDRCQGEQPTPHDRYYKSGMHFVAPYNMWARLKSKIPVQPIYEQRDVLNIFPNSALFKANWQRIRDEALAISSRGLDAKIKNDTFFTTIAPEGWTRFYLKWYSKELDPKALKAAPFTCHLIQQCPEVKLAMFSILKPNSHILPHRGPFRGALRYHLGLQCPSKDCQLMIDGQPYQWKDGEHVMFDDTYMHSVQNDSNETRVILFLDVARPMKSQSSSRFNDWVCNTFGSLTTRGNDNQEKVVSTK